MRFKLLRRRLTISAPRMSVRSALPWPFRWAVLALVFGFCAAIGLWAFEFGKVIAGLDRHTTEEFAALTAEVTRLKAESAKAQAVSDTAETLLTTQKAAQERMLTQTRLLEEDNQRLRDDLGFFEKLFPASQGEAMSIRGLGAQLENGRQIKWQALLMQAQKGAQAFSGRLEFSASGLQAGKPWMGALPNGTQVIAFKQYGRFEGVIELPAQITVKSITARVMDGGTARATQSVKL